MCQPQLSFDAQALSARIGRVEEQLASGAFTAAPRSVQKAALPEDVVDDERPPLPDDADDPLRGMMPDGQPGQAAPQRAASAANDTAFWPDFVLNIIRKPAVQELVQKKASAALGRPITVRFARKDQVSENGNDPMDALVAFGGQHNDIFTIK